MTTGREVGGHASSDATVHDLPPLPVTLTQSADPDAATWCPCGHWTGGDYMCLNGRIYGPCDSEFCGGVCDDTHGTCKADGCACEESDHPEYRQEWTL